MNETAKQALESALNMAEQELDDARRLVLNAELRLADRKEEVENLQKRVNDFREVLNGKN